MVVDVIKQNLDGFKGEAWLVKKNARYFVVSGVSAMFSGWEVLVFPSDEHGNVSDWGEVVGGKGISHEEAIEMLDEVI